MDYLPRVVHDELDQLMPGVPAIALDGARGVGKTATATRRARTVLRLDDPGVRSVLGAEPGRIASSAKPVLIDEWQLMSETWDVVRRAVDDDPTGGQFLLTSSASPRNPPTHTGAGRIVSLRLRPMTLMERGVGRPTVSLRGLLSGTRHPLTGETDVTATDYAREIIASGFPGLRSLRGRALRAQLDGYIERTVDRDFEDLGGRTVRNPVALRRWLAALAGAVSSTASYEAIRDAANAGHANKPTKVTMLHWVDTLERLWLSEPVPAWSPSGNELARLAQRPKHQLVDPAIAARLRGADEDALLSGAAAGPLGPRGATLFGALFESLVTLGVRVFAQAAEARVGHFRTRNGDREIDLVVERADGRIVAIEVKLAQAVTDADVRHLAWLQNRLGPQVLDAIVVTTGRHAVRRSDGIGVVPAALLGP